MDKPIELSKPVAWADSNAVDILKAGKWSPVFPEKYQDSFPLYSQEYVSALLEKLRIAESDRDKNGWYVHECGRLQKLLEIYGVKNG